MSIKRILAVISAFCVSLCSTSFFTADAAETHNVRIHDLNGEIIKTISVPHGEAVDLSAIDTAGMESYINEYTQIGFNSWSEYPETVTKDLDIYALYVKMTISGSIAKKTEYFSKKGKLNTEGIGVSIMKYIQTPQKDENGNFIITAENTDITDACEITPTELSEVFSESNNGTIKIIPPKSNRAFTYNVSYFPGLGDIDHSSIVDADDASIVLTYYTMISTGQAPDLTENEKLICDIDRNNIIDADDASCILSYYTAASTTSSDITWDEFLLS